ncbi:MAG: M3 family metallopeptidase [Candidatus Dojkabacteria bacterium]|nr:M3 family metallopeptidase [Candidatus Dojkabacteria bacterium]
MSSKKYHTEWNLNVILNKFHAESIESLISQENQKYTDFFNKWNIKNIVENIETLLEYLDEFNRILEDHGKYLVASAYTSLRLSLNSEDNEAKSLENKIFDIEKYIQQNFESYRQKIVKYLKENPDIVKDSKFAKYKHFLELMLEESKYKLSEEGENIIFALSKTVLSNWKDLTSRLLSTSTGKIKDNGEQKEYTFEELLTISTKDTSKIKRDKAVYALNKIFEKWSPVIETEINSVLEYSKTIDELRKYSDPEEKRLFYDEVSKQFVNSLINAVKNNYSFSREYYKTKAKLLGKRKLKYNERLLKYGDVQQRFSSGEAINLVHKGLNEIGAEYGQIFEQMLIDGRIDFLPKKGKRGGAFFMGFAKQIPGFILLNYTGTINDISTIAHETGHAIHFELTRANQPGIYCDYSTAIAEVASTFFEDLVADFVLGDMKRDDDKIAFIVNKLDDFISSVHRQIAIYSFERRLHEEFKNKGYLSSKDIDQMFIEEMSDYLGNSVDMKGFEKYWVYINHIRYFFYVYSYASGLIISKTLQTLYKENRENINKVKHVLSAGCSNYVKDIFSEIGLDVEDENFWRIGLENNNIYLEEIKRR